MLMLMRMLAITMSITRNGRYTRKPIRKPILSSASMYAGTNTSVGTSPLVRLAGSEVSMPR